MKTIRIKGIKDVPRFEAYVDSSLIDIAYVEDVVENIVILLIDSEVNINDVEDEKWITTVINEGLIECEETSANISFE